MIDAVKNSNLAQNNLMQLKKACRGFEEIMVQKMLEAMDKTVPQDPLVKNDAPNSIYKSMYIDALSKKIAQSGSFGLGKMLFNSLKDYVDYKNNIKHTPQIKPVKMDTKMIKLKKEIKMNPLKQGIVFKKKNSNVKSANKNELIKKAVDMASSKYHVPKKLIYSIIKAESDFNPSAISSVGAIGLMQLMPATALELGVKNVWDIEENIMGGTKYIASLLKRFKSERLAIAAYNAGPGNVAKYRGVPPFRETKHYVDKVLAYVDGKY